MKISKFWTKWIAIGLLPLAVSLNAAGAKTEKVVLNTQVGEEIRDLDPQLATGVSSAHININMFSGFYEYGHQKGEPVPDIALSHTSNADSTVWTFKMKPDIHWVKLENGEVKKMRPLTAHDVVFSYRRMLSPATASEYAYMLYILKNGEAFNKGTVKDPEQLGVKALDDHTVQLTLEGSVPSLIQYLPHHSFHFVPKEPIEQYKEKWIETGKMWTTGAFTFKEWKLKDRITLVKNPHYPTAKDVQIDEINFRFIGTYSPEAVRVFRAGKTDIDLEPPPASELPDLIKSKNLKAARKLGTYFVRVNVTKPALKDWRVRKALALTIPRDEIVKYVMKTGEIPTFSFVPNAFEGYTPPKLTDASSGVPNTFEGQAAEKKQVEEAQKLMAEAGYPGGKGFPQIKYLYNTAENHKKIAVVLSKAWKEKLGIDVVPYNQEWKVYLNSQTNMDYDISRSGWIADMADPMNFVEMFITDGGNNKTGFSNKDFDRLISQARIERDLNKRNKMMEQAEAILMKELPVLPIFNYTAQSLVQHYVSGFYANKMDQHPMKFVKIDMAKRKKLFPNAIE